MPGHLPGPIPMTVWETTLGKLLIWKVFRIGTVHYNWPMSAHASQAFSVAHCTDSEDLPLIFSERELMFTFAVCRRPSVCLSSLCLSVVCNVRAPYSGDWNFQQCFYAIWYLGHLRPFGKNFTEIVPGLNQRGVEKCSDFGPFQGYMSEKVQDRR